MTTLERGGQPIPDPIRQAERLTRFAVFTRYPGVAPPVSAEEYQEAVTAAEAGVDWATSQIRTGLDP